MSKKIVIIGAGIAGLTAAIQILKQSDVKPIILEAEPAIGGLLVKNTLDDNIVDVGGHRFFSKDQIINDLWQELMPLMDNSINQDDIRLLRTRISRIYFKNKFFNYPLSINVGAIHKLGLGSTIKAGASYLKAQLIKKEEINLENFYINRFGNYLYRTFFMDYTEKVWGRHPREINANWGIQRIKGLSLKKAIGNALSKPFRHNEDKVEASLITQFTYPKYGPSAMIEKIKEYCLNYGAMIRTNAKVTKINVINQHIHSIIINENEEITADEIISSMPIKDLISAINDDTLSNELRQIANQLPYRNLISVTLLLNDLNIHQQNQRINDTWLYIQDPSVKLGRIQIYNNWSPYLVKNNETETMIGLEYFTNDDSLWQLDNQAIIDLAINEAIHINIIKRENILKSSVHRIKKAYPAYFDSYQHINKIISYINQINNLYCIGRNGQHRYNNMDHSMLTAITAVNVIFGKTNKENIWRINSKQEYHED